MMQTFKTYVTIDNPAQVILSNLPFQKGQRVEIVVFPLKQNLNALDRLRTLTDSFPLIEARFSPADYSDEDFIDVTKWFEDESQVQ
ncbi:MAG: hypothetical protein ACO37W_14365 [Prochlorotrichaceae cyanobacterium]